MKKSTGKLNKIIALLLVITMVLSPCDFSNVAYANEITLDEKVTLIETESTEDTIVKLADTTATSYTYNGYTYTTGGYGPEGGTISSYTNTYNVSDSAITIGTNNSVYYVTGTYSNTSTVSHKITVSSNVTTTIVLYNCSITTGTSAPIYISSGANVTIIVLGTCSMTATYQSAGIYVNENAKLTITGNGTLTAQGGDRYYNSSKVTTYYAGAGIGGNGTSGERNCGTVNITGDVTVFAYGGDATLLFPAGAGIGGGGAGTSGTGGNGGTVSITGNAVVIAVAGSDALSVSADDIGSGSSNASDNGSLAVDENAIVIVTSSLPSGVSGTKDGGIVIIDSTAYIYGDITFTDDYTFPDGVKTIVLADDVTITVESGVVVDFNDADTIFKSLVSSDNSNSDDDGKLTIEVVLQTSTEEDVSDGVITGYYPDPSDTTEDADGNTVYSKGNINNPITDPVFLNISSGNIFIGSYTSGSTTYQRFYQTTEMDSAVIDGALDNSINWSYVVEDVAISITGTSEYTDEKNAYTITVIRGTHNITFNNLKIVAKENPPLELGTYYDDVISTANITLTLSGANYLIAGGEQQAIYYSNVSSLTITNPENIGTDYLIATSQSEYVVLDSSNESEISAQMLKMTFLDVEQVTGSMITELTLVKYDSTGTVQSTNDFSIKQENIANFAFKSIAITLPVTAQGEYFKVYAHGVEIYAVADADYPSSYGDGTAYEDNDYVVNGLYTSEFTTESNTIVKYWLATSMSEDEFKIIEGEYYRRINLVADITAMDEYVEDIAYDSAVTLILKSSTLDIATDEESGNGYFEFDIVGTIPAGTKMTIVTFGVYSQIQGCNYYTLKEDLTGTTEEPAKLSTLDFKDITGNSYNYNNYIDIKLVMDFSDTVTEAESTSPDIRAGFTASLDAKETIDNEDGTFTQNDVVISVSVKFKSQYYERTIDATLNEADDSKMQTTTVDDSNEDSYIVGDTVSFSIDISTYDINLPKYDSTLTKQEDIGYIVVLEFAHFVSDNVQIELSTDNIANSDSAYATSTTLECAVLGTEVMINGFVRFDDEDESDVSYSHSGGVITFYDMPAGDYMVTPKLVQKVSVYEKFGEELDWMWYYPETTDTAYCEPIYFTVVSPELVVTRADGDTSRIIDASEDDQTLTFKIEKTDDEKTSVVVLQKTWDTLADPLGYSSLSETWETSSSTDSSSGIETVTITVPQGTSSGTYRIAFETSDAQAVYYNIIVE